MYTVLDQMKQREKHLRANGYYWKAETMKLLISDYIARHDVQKEEKNEKQTNDTNGDNVAGESGAV